MTASQQLESIAARSAKISWKRSQILFSGNGNACSILVPSIDPALHKSSVTRRIQFNYHQGVLDTPTIAYGEDNNFKKKSSSGKKGLTSRVIEELRNDHLKKLRDGCGGEEERGSRADDSPQQS